MLKRFKKFQQQEINQWLIEHGYDINSINDYVNMKLKKERQYWVMMFFIMLLVFVAAYCKIKE